MIYSRILLTSILSAVAQSIPEYNSLEFDENMPEDYKHIAQGFPSLIKEGGLSSVKPKSGDCNNNTWKSRQNCEEVCTDYTPYVINVYNPKTNKVERNLVVQNNPMFTQTLRERKCVNPGSKCFSKTFGGSASYNTQCNTCTTPVQVYIWNPVDRHVEKKEFVINTCCKCNIYEYDL